MTDKMPQTLQDVIDEPVTCPNCKGKGEVFCESLNGSNKDGLVTCPMCGGTGMVKKDAD